MGAQPDSDNYYQRLGLQTTVLPKWKRTNTGAQTQEEVNKMVYDNWSKSTNVITIPDQRKKLEEASPRLKPAQGPRRARLTLPGSASRRGQIFGIWRRAKNMHSHCAPSRPKPRAPPRDAAISHTSLSREPSSSW